MESLGVLLTGAVLVVIAHLAWLHFGNSKGPNPPPGPTGWPIFGYLPFLGRNHHAMFMDLARKYGPIVRQVGTVTIVVINDFQLIKAVFTNNAVQSRIRSPFLELTGFPGVGTLNGQAWSENRQLSMKILRSLGVGKASLEEVIMDEVRDLTERFAAKNGTPTFARKEIVTSTSNVFTSLFFGARFPHHHPKRAALNKLLLLADTVVCTGSLVMFLPNWMYEIVALIPFTKMYYFKKAFGALLGFIRTQVKDHEQMVSTERTQDYIHCYLESVKQHLDEPNPHIKRAYISGNIQNFLGAGTNAIQRSLAWLMFNCAHKPGAVQEKIQEEIDRVVGRERQPIWKDHHEMPFTMATIWEMQRWRPILPLTLPRATDQDVELGGYIIPKGTIIMSNIWAVNMNADLWDEPEEFNPQRFLEHGGRLRPKPQHFIPFSVGKRMCPAEGLAPVEIFLFLTGILQRFTVRPEEGKTIDLTVDSGAFNSPTYQKLRFLPR
ncbi:unnamed protein product [Ixodes hexagonus]